MEKEENIRTFTEEKEKKLLKKKDKMVGKEEKDILRDRLWDGITKYIADHMTTRLLPLINEQFKKNYAKETSIRLMQTEYAHFVDEMKPGTVLCDITLLVDQKDIYHLECQMTNDGEMVIRMIEYDLLFSLRHGKIVDAEGDIEIHFPQSTVIYPACNGAIPRKLKCTVVFPDKRRFIYEIPTMRIQDYSLEEIEEKHLDFFLPFTMLRFVPRLKSKKNPLTKNELTEFVRKIILILEEEYKAGEISEENHKIYLNMIRLAAQRVFYHKPELQQEVENMTPYTLKFPEDILREKLQAEIAELSDRIAEMDNQIADKEKQIVDKNNQITDKNNQITDKENQIVDKEKQIVDKENQIVDKEKQIAYKDNQIAEKDKQLAVRQSEIERLLAENESLRKQIRT